MSEHEFEVGTEVAFYGGKGAVVDIDKCNQNTLLKVLTSSGKIRVIPNNFPSLISL